MPRLAWWRPTVPWTPTPAQAAVAERLTREPGGIVRTHEDGTAEVRTTEGGEIRHYALAQDGTVQLVAVRPPNRRYALGKQMMLTGMAFVVSAFVLAVVEDRLPPWLQPEVIFVLGLAAVFTGGAMGARRIEPTRERWTRTGGPDH